MEKVIIRKNKLFIIDKSKLKPEARKEEIFNALYAAVYEEFQGADKNPTYKNLNSLDKLEQLNSYAYNWLKQKGFI
jgi:hypothetical protein